MKTPIAPIVVAMAVLSTSTTPLSTAFAQGTAFTYQGRFNDGGNPYTGSAEFQPTLWSAPSGGAQVAANTPATIILGVTNGLFVLPLNFGAAPFAAGADRWLQLEVRTTIGAFTTLSPRQALTPTPYAMGAGNLTGTLPASRLTGTLPSAQLGGTYSGVLSFNNAGNSFNGGGAGLTGLNASQLTSGTVPDARLSGNVALTSQVWLLGGNTGLNPALNFVGTLDSTPLPFRAGNREVMRLEGQSTGYRIIAGTASTVNPASTNSAILGGRNNVIGQNAHETSIVGGQDNAIGDEQRSAFIGGGARNEVLLDNQHAVIAGGRDNRIGTNSVITAILGGGDNIIANNVDGGLLLGGFRNDIRGSLNPNARLIAPVIVGGSDNEIGFRSNFASILGGDDNIIGTNAVGAAILGGINNDVANNASNAVAIGRSAKANHAGAFVWADNRTTSYGSARENSFNIRAEGGLHLSGDSEMSFGSSVRQMINLWGTEYGIGVQSGTLYNRTDVSGSFSWHRGGTHSDNANSPGAGGVEMMRLNSGGLRVNGTFVSASDRNMKENIRPVEPLEVLSKVAALPINAWNYRADPASRHVGPMAQDFKAAFGLGEDDKHIATVDADGVALAAIQGLNQKVEDLKTELKRRDAENAELKSRLTALEKHITNLGSKEN